MARRGYFQRRPGPAADIRSAATHRYNDDPD